MAPEPDSRLRRDPRAVEHRGVPLVTVQASPRKATILPGRPPRFAAGAYWKASSAISLNRVTTSSAGWPPHWRYIAVTFTTMRSDSPQVA